MCFSQEWENIYFLDDLFFPLTFKSSWQLVLRCDRLYNTEYMASDLVRFIWYTRWQKISKKNKQKCQLYLMTNYSTNKKYDSLLIIFEPSFPAANTDLCQSEWFKLILDKVINNLILIHSDIALASLEE